MMTSSEIRQSFLDFFRSKQHTIVPSSSLLPDAPNLLFTNAGMNQFVPIFLGQQKCPYNPPRAADTQKCIRAGGKHNDLEDVGLDTYHHTFFEMLGNWSFGDYFKKEAIEWAWELVTGIWKFPKERLYATVYNPDRSKNDPSDLDQEAYDHWARLFTAAGLDPKVHIVYGGKKDNFWMMGETGPCGPCSEIHVDLTPEGNTRGSLVNKGDARCIEIWNLVFIQFNANPDGTFSPLPARHVDTGMGFERVTSIIQGTKGFSDFKNAKISNYETDIFRPIFTKLEDLSKKSYRSTLPQLGVHALFEQEKIDIAFRVIADHIRTLTFAIADGIEPGNTDRNYVLRRILRRAVRYGRNLDFREPFLFKLVAVLCVAMGDVFPNIPERRGHIEDVIQREEESFNVTLDRGIDLFNFISGGNNLVLSVFTSERVATGLPIPIQEVAAMRRASKYFDERALALLSHLASLSAADVEKLRTEPGRLEQALINVRENPAVKEKALAFLTVFPSDKAFDLYHTYGFPVDLTEVMARERALTVNPSEIEKLMELERERSRAAQKKTAITVGTAKTVHPTQFIGYDSLQVSTKVQDMWMEKGRTVVTLESSACYPEMGGQVGDTGVIASSDKTWRIVNTQKYDRTFLHVLAESEAPIVGSQVVVSVDRDRRDAIQRHHTVTHLLHWALHEVVSKEASQKGSYVGPEKLTFDFNNAPLTPKQVADVEKLVNERILENAGVSWIEVPYAEIKGRKDVMQFFGEKYGDTVRVVQIGGQSKALDGYSMELCGGTHARATGEIGLFRIVGESAIAAGVRRIEAVAGLEAYNVANQQLHVLKNLAGKVNSPLHELEKKVESLLAQQKELEKQLKATQQKQAAETAHGLITKAQNVGATRAIIENLGPADGDYLQSIADSLKGQFKGVVVLGGVANNAVSLVATVSPDLTSKIQAGKIIQAIAPIVGGKGGGKPDNARGGGKDAVKLDEALAKARELLT
jgi:alanyl-tRNA synthetase